MRKRCRGKRTSLLRQWAEWSFQTLRKESALMAEKRAVRFGKWLLKVAISYMVFIGIGWLLGRIPAGRFGLPEEMLLNLRMFLMILGPIYLTLIVKIVLTILAAIKHREKDTAEQNSGVLFAVTAILLLVNLSNAQTIADLSSGLIEGKGLKSLNRSQRYTLKGKRFLNIFLPIAFYMLILEILTLLVCIVTFEPLHDTTNRAFIFTIALTALLLLLIPIILTFISGFKGDKAEHEEKREKERQAAVASGDLVLETDPIRRRKYLRLPKLLALLVCPGVLLLSFLVLFFTQNAQDYLVVFLLRRLFMALAAASLFAVIPLLMYWANCSGTSLVQRVYLSENRLCYTGYRGSMDERVEFAFVLLRLESFRVEKRSIRIRGTFARITKDTYGVYKKNCIHKTIWIPRTFSEEQERVLLDYLKY